MTVIPIAQISDVSCCAGEKWHTFATIELLSSTDDRDAEETVHSALDGLLVHVYAHALVLFSVLSLMICIQSLLVKIVPRVLHCN